MTKMLVPILLVLLALALLPRGVDAPGADVDHAIRLLGYDLRVRISLQPAAAPSAVLPLPDSLRAETMVEEVTP